LSLPEKLIRDLLSIMYTFTRRLHRIRRYEKALQDDPGAGGR
jgi:hypothetical protein